MCGISGFVGAGNRNDLQRMGESLAHRGPDASGIWQDSDLRVYLGHRRLAIIDLKDGRQPMSTADGTLTITFNGEIYNHIEIRCLLEKKGYRFHTDHSDTEVLLHGYREWGSRLPEKLNGMWAFAICDKKNKKLFLSRDRFGKKPLYYTCLNGTFIFASELTTLTKHQKVETSLSERGLLKYFAYGYIPAPYTIFERIYKLPGGYSLTFHMDRCRYDVSPYWEFVLEPVETVPRNPEKIWGEQLRALISNAVERRLMADVPLGIFLSGGIDSSSITAFAQKAGTQRIKTFSIGFEDASFDESDYSNRVATALGTEHHHETLSWNRAKYLLPEISKRLDEPMGDSSLLPTYLLSKSTRKHVTVALGGDGADELFAGYDPFLALRKAELYARLVPKPIHRGIRMLAARLPVAHRNMSLDFKIKRTLRGLSYPKKLWNPVWLGPLDPAGLKDLFNRSIDVEDVYSEAIEQWDACRQESIIDKTLQFYTRLYLQDDILMKVDRASMMNSLEVRAPYLDIELADFVRKIPSSYKFRNGQTKYILKKALEPVLPRDVVYRSKKGFGIPIGRWMKNGVFNSGLLAAIGSLNCGFTEARLKEHQENRADNRAFLWNTWLLNEWLSSHPQPHNLPL
jgi:asparagine synthase (glutamine-hydrolysing)